MRTNIEVIAELSGTYGEVREIIETKSHNQTLPIEVLMFCDEKGNFSKEHYKGKITKIQYSVVEGPVIGDAGEDNCFSIPFSKYIEWGKPGKISVRGQVTLSPLDS